MFRLTEIESRDMVLGCELNGVYNWNFFLCRDAVANEKKNMDFTNYEIRIILSEGHMIILLIEDKDHTDQKNSQSV